MRYRDTRAIARAAHRCPSVRAPPLDRDRREWGTRARADWRRALAPTEISARGSLAWDQVAHRRSDARGPCIPSRRVFASLSSYSSVLSIIGNARPFPARAALKVERTRRRLENDTWLCAEASRERALLHQVQRRWREKEKERERRED